MQNDPSASQSKGELINKLSAESNKQIYLFKDGKLVESYGKGKSGGSISIAYDSKTGKYVNLYDKDRGSYGSIYEALASGQGNYSASELVKMHALMAASKEVQKGETGTGVAPDRVPDKPTSKNPNQTAKPEPIDYLLGAIEQNKQKAAQLTKGTEEYLKSVFGDGKGQGGQVTNSKGTQAEIGQFDSNGVPIPKIVNPGWKPEPFGDRVTRVGAGLLVNGNLPLAILSSAGELLDHGSQAFAHTVSHIEGGRETLELVGRALGTAKHGIAKMVFTEQEYQKIITWHQSLPHGVQVLVSAGTDGFILYGAGSAIKLGVGGISKSNTLLTSVSKMESAELGQKIKTSTFTKLEHKPISVSEKVVEAGSSNTTKPTGSKLDDQSSIKDVPSGVKPEHKPGAKTPPASQDATSKPIIVN